MILCKLQNDVLAKAIKVLSFDEGAKNKPYRDSKGLWTIGIGRLVGRNLSDLYLSTHVIHEMLMEDICSHWEQATNIFEEEFLNKQTPARQIAILSLAFGLGENKLKQFTETIPAIKKEKWELAAWLLLKTKWARDVDPQQIRNRGRDDRIAFMLKTGEFHEEYNI